MESLREFFQPVIHALILGSIGVLIGIGNLMRSGADLSPTVIIGRAIVSGGLGTASAAVLIWFPTVPIVAQLGLAAALASLGTSGIERVARGWSDHMLKRLDK